MKNKLYIKSEKGLSVIVGYVLLITFSAVIGVLVYNWMRTYIPQQEINCPDGVSLLIVNYSCSSNILTLDIKNNGKFDIGGYFIYATDSSDEELATIDLSKNNTDSNSKLQPLGIKFGQIGTENSLKPNDNETDTYNLIGISNLYSIEILPIRWQEEKNRKMLVTCKDVSIKKRIECI